MTVFQAIVLGAIQGLSEFLPISSSAHLLLSRWILGWPDPGLAFDVALHLGTLSAVLFYFRREWWRLLLASMRVVRGRRAESADERRVVLLVVATLPAVVGGLLLADYAETVFRNPVIPAITLIVLGVLLWAVDRAAPRDRALAEMRWPTALLIGIAQVLALVPGVSRSGSTMTAGRALRLDRESAAVYSFLMSMPITAAAALLEVPHLLAGEQAALPLVVGIVASALSGWAAIAVLLRYVSKHSYGVFAVYRVLVGLLVLSLVVTRA
jgi:undecaprenyl-diphosphatase